MVALQELWKMFFKSSILLKPKAINSIWSFSFKFQAYQGFRSIWPAVIVCNLPFLLGGRGIEPPNKFSKRGGGLDRTSTFRGVCWERGGYFFFRGIPIFEIFNDKKSLQAKIFFSVITKNSNWEISTKNRVKLGSCCELTWNKVKQFLGLIFYFMLFHDGNILKSCYFMLIMN